MTHEGTMAANPARFTIDCRGETCLTQDAADTLDLETCVCRYSLLLFRLAYGVLRNSHDAEDVVQETFLRAHRQGIASVRDTQAWLATVAFRIAVDRKRKTEPLPLAEYGVPSGQPNAERLAIRREQVERLQTLITSLPEAFRLPLVLSAIDELNSRQIGEMLGLPESSVRGPIMRARQILKDKTSALSESEL
ncbi:MAG TPA: RNA polymerase sigma factor [Candidatus Binatia bacterium]|nr:RNA polymerase sigma factor [Candidatus Binatia bacterium]